MRERNGKIQMNLDKERMRDVETHASRRWTIGQRHELRSNAIDRERNRETWKPTLQRYGPFAKKSSQSHIERLRHKGT